MPQVLKTEWAAFTADRPNTHLLQTGNWASLKEAFGWRARYVIVEDSGALILLRQLPLGFSLGYIPKGPVGVPVVQLWQEIDEVCRRERAILLKGRARSMAGIPGSKTRTPTRRIYSEPACHPTPAHDRFGPEWG